MKAGTGYSNKKDAFEAGREAAVYAMQSQGIDRADLVLAFRRGYLDHNEYFKGIKSVTGNSAPIIGGSAVGVITNNDLSYKEYASGVLIINSNDLIRKVLSVGDIDKDMEKSGEQLGDALEMEGDGKLFLLFYDSIKTPPKDDIPPVLNSSSLLLKGIGKHSRKKIPIVGAGLLGDYTFDFSRQFYGADVGCQKAVGVLLGGNFNAYTRITHGCTPLDGVYYKITRIDGSIIYELDGKPITEVIDDMYGDNSWRGQYPVKLLTVGVNYGERYDLSEESTCVNRLILGALPNGEGISLFESDLENGALIRFMVRDTDEMMNSARINAEGIMSDITARGERPVFGLYIDCAGRTAEYQNILSEEAAIIQEVFNRYGVQLFGFYSGVEIAPVGEVSKGLDWTGVLLVFSEVLK